MCTAQIQNKSHWSALYYNQFPLRRKARNHQIVLRGLIDVTIKPRSFPQVYMYLKEWYIAWLPVMVFHSNSNSMWIQNSHWHCYIHYDLWIEINSMDGRFEFCQYVQRYHTYFLPSTWQWPYFNNMEKEKIIWALGLSWLLDCHGFPHVFLDVTCGIRLTYTHISGLKFTG